MTSRTTPAPTKRTGGRAAAVVTAVHQATLALLTEVGYAAMQMPDIASRAGVNKTTVYRRWPTKAELVADLLLDLSRHDRPSNDTGNLFDDLVALLHDIADLLASAVGQALLRASISGDIDATTRRTFWDERIRSSSVIIERALAREELPSGTDPRGLLEHAVSTVYFRALVTGEPTTHDDIRLFAQRAIAAARNL